MSNINTRIKNWISNQPYWVQLAAIKIYMQEQINDELINKLLELLKENTDPQQDDKINLAHIFIDSKPSTAVIHLSSIGNIKNINNLAPRKPLTFSPNLSVVYGLNGSGKSGYTRILKKIYGKHNANDLFPNIFKNTLNNSQCTIVANIDGNKKEFTWPNNADCIEKLKSIDIFDSQIGTFYIDKEKEVSYLPKEVSLFEGLVNIFQILQKN